MSFLATLVPPMYTTLSALDFVMSVGVTTLFEVSALFCWSRCCVDAVFAFPSGALLADCDPVRARLLLLNQKGLFLKNRVQWCKTTHGYRLVRCTMALPVAGVQRILHAEGSAVASRATPGCRVKRVMVLPCKPNDHRRTTSNAQAAREDTPRVAWSLRERANLPAMTPLG